MSDKPFSALERMRAKQTALHGSTKPPENASPPKLTKKVIKPSKPATPNNKPDSKKIAPVMIDVKFSCGHTVNCKKNKKNVPEKKCPPCRIAAEAEKMAEAKAKKEAIAAGLPAQPTKKKGSKFTPPSCGRLPHGAEFHVRYDGVSQKWVGNLLIPATEHAPDGTFGPWTFDNDKSGVFPLLRRLDGQFRERYDLWFAENAKETTDEHAESESGGTSGSEVAGPGAAGVGAEDMPTQA